MYTVHVCEAERRIIRTGRVKERCIKRENGRCVSTVGFIFSRVDKRLWGLVGKPGSPSNCTIHLLRHQSSSLYPSVHLLI